MNNGNDLNNPLVLVKALKAGDTKAFDKLYKEYYKMVDTYVKNNSGTSDDAQDIFQEALIVLVQNLQKEGFELNAKVSTYIFAIVRQLWLYRIRGQKGKNTKGLGEKEDSLPDSGEDEINLKEENEKRYESIANNLEKLGEICKKIIIGFYYEKKSMAKLAKECNYTDGFVRQRKLRCMNELKGLIEKDKF